SMSGTTLARWAPTPSSAAAPTPHHAGHGRPGSPSVTNAGSAPKPITYGSQDNGVRFTPRSYDHAAATPTRCAAPATRPLASDSGTQAASATPAATATLPRPTRPARTGLARRLVS